MPIYRPQYSPKPHPYGALKDITPAELEALFASANAANPSYTNYRVKTSGRYRVMAYVGETTSPKNLYLFVTRNAGEDWQRKDWTFGPDHIMEDGFVDSRYESNTLYFATRTFTPGGDFPSIETYISDNLGDSWAPAWSITEPGYSFNRHRIFPTSGGVYQIADAVLDESPFTTKLLGYKDGVKVLDQTTSPQIAIGGITVSSYTSKYNLGYFALEFTTFLGGAEIWKVSSSGFELMGKMPESALTIPPTNIRPPLQQLWHLPKKGVLYAPTLVQSGARLYTSFDQGKNWKEQAGGVTINVPELSTIGRKGILEAPATGERYRNEGFMQGIESSSLFTDILDTFSDGVDWDFGLESRLSRRGSKLYLFKNP